ncbi:MAG: hypothetical protein AMXMBFR61_19450 [Fimbriimonadales bacterium]
MSGAKPAAPRAFTLIELLVVIAIIAILAAILFPVFARARESSQNTVCSTHMRQVGLSITLYYGDYNETLPITWTWTQGWCDKNASWKQLCKHYQKEDNLYKCPLYSGPRVDCTDYFVNPQVRWTGEYGVNNWAYIDSFTNADPNAGDYYRKRSAKVIGMGAPAETIIVSENGDGDWISEPEDLQCKDPVSGFTMHTVDPGVIKFRHVGKRSATVAFVDGHMKMLTRDQLHARNCYYWWRQKKE